MIDCQIWHRISHTIVIPPFLIGIDCGAINHSRNTSSRPTLTPQGLVQKYLCTAAAFSTFSLLLLSVAATCLNFYFPLSRPHSDEQSRAPRNKSQHHF